MTSRPNGVAEIYLPPITDEDRQLLHYNPNTDDLVDWVREYACRAVQNALQQHKPAAPPPPAADERVRELAAQAVDIWHDGQSNPPETRCYVDGAFYEVMGELSAALSARKADDKGGGE